VDLKQLNIDEKRSCLRIAVTVPAKGTFFYEVPKNLSPKAQVGCRVLVPFNNRKITGYILEKVSKTKDQNLKEILDIIDPEPLFHKQQVPFFEWMADYYMHPIGQLIQSALPAGLNMDPFKTALLTEKGLNALKSLSSFSKEKRLLLWIKNHPGRRLPGPLKEYYLLEKKGWLMVRERRKKRQTGPLMRKFVRPKKNINPQSVCNVGPFKAKNEREFLETVLSTDATLLRELTAKFGNGSYLVKKWTRKGILEECTGAVYRNPAGEIMQPSRAPIKLFEQQKRVIDHIRKYLDKKTFSACLLHGVTGSGKTEVYYRVAKYAIRSGRQVIVMVPEIALCVYMEGLFRSRLGNRIGIYHSGLSIGERYDEWMRMVRGDVDLVIGARSALFSPLPKLGLIIVDEEHDTTYKQETSPRYQARDAAVVRAKLEKALVTLGSGTPSVQSIYNALNGRYHLLCMPDRIEKRPPPDVEIADMKTLDDKQSRFEILSPQLRQALDQNLNSGNQAILFLNRRGFYRLFLCRSCGDSIRCPNCDVALTYHLKEDQLTCHYCGFYSGTQIKCPSCGREGLKSYGFGTEKLEQTLHRLFPAARIARLDADSTRKKGQAFQILKRFSEHKIDILVGTQMITKGYDFPKVTLVGVIAADLSLGFPDFRAGERTFQILSQVAGRSGRGNQRGRVIIQTFNPDHYALNTATSHNYRSFFTKEKELRKQLGYPPFSHLACLRFFGNSKDSTADAAKRLNLVIRGILAKWPKRGKEIQVLGPVEAPIFKLKGKYRWQILLKSKSTSLLHHLLSKIESIAKGELKSSGVHLILDVDPYQML
jgi:primosomal protein N' (replication factor Y)